MEHHRLAAQLEWLREFLSDATVAVSKAIQADLAPVLAKEKDAPDKKQSILGKNLLVDEPLKVQSHSFVDEI